MFYDTHCHLNSDEFIDRIEEILKTAEKRGVTLFNIVGYDFSSCKRAIELIEKYTHLYGILGVHPCDILKTTKKEFRVIAKLLRHPRVVALGEIGLDYYWVKNPSEREKQKEVFITQIELANILELPIVVHCRDATEDTYEILKKHRPSKGGVMHCYSGSVEMMQKFLDLGMYISLAGPVTFKNSITPKEVAIAVPLNRLLIETDSPYLAPHPYRGKTNEPALLPYVAQEIAKLRNMTVEEIAKITRENGTTLFHVKQNENKN